MYYLALEFIQFVVGIIFIIQAYRSDYKRILNYLIGGFFIILFIMDINHSLRVIDQVYYLNNKKISSVEIDNYSRYYGVESIQSSIKIDQSNEIRELQKMINSAKITSLQQPNITKSISLNFIQNENKNYEYVIESSTNNGIIISVKINDSHYGSFRNDSLFKRLYDHTKNSFFQEGIIP